MLTKEQLESINDTIHEYNKDITYELEDIEFINGEWQLFLLILILATFIIYRHRENIKRIKAGTEPKIKW